MTLTSPRQAGAAEATAASVVVVGSLNMDLVATAERLPARGETLHGDRFFSTPGGKGGNQAVAGARMGATVRMVGCVGDDAHGRELVAALRADGVDTQAVRTTAAQASGVALIVVGGQGDNSIVVVAGANAALGQDDIDSAQSAIASSRLLVAQCETPLPAVQAALQCARAQGVTTLLNAAPATPGALSLLPWVDWLVVNEVEAQALTGQAVRSPADAATAAAALHQRGVLQVVVTLGRQGLVAQLADGEPLMLAAPPVQAIDATGAGDTFVGALAALLARSEAPGAAIATAQLAAALSVTRSGAQRSMPSATEVQAFAQDREMTA